MGFKQAHHPQSIRILRRDTNDRIEVIREWTPNPGTTVPTEWPALEWGDIVEVRIPAHAISGMPHISKFAALIPDRTVTFRLGDLEVPKTISGGETFWLDRYSGKALQALIPEIEVSENPQRFAIHREGLAEPITLDFSEPTTSRFRLLDGDTAEVFSSDIAEKEGEFRLTVTQEGIQIEGAQIAKEQRLNLAEVFAFLSVFGSLLALFGAWHWTHGVRGKWRMRAMVSGFAVFCACGRSPRWRRRMPLGQTWRCAMRKSKRKSGSPAMMCGGSSG